MFKTNKQKNSLKKQKVLAKKYKGPNRNFKNEK